MSQTHATDDVVRASTRGAFHSDFTRWAWISLVCTVLTLPAGIVAGSALIDWLGYDPNNLEGAALGCRPARRVRHHADHPDRTPDGLRVRPAGRARR